MMQSLLRKLTVFNVTPTYLVVKSCQTTICEITGGSCVFLIYFSDAYHYRKCIATFQDSWDLHWQNGIDKQVFDFIQNDAIEKKLSNYRIEVKI